mmetsp:Transcript_26123/g.52068  ORF Transcript_26123/g.52068 Transcript_26123/m.52068 type:complete len:82 (-) Transcript_26123:416-661(-)
MISVPPAESNLSTPHCIRRQQNLWAFLSLSNNYMNKRSKVSAPTHKDYSCPSGSWSVPAIALFLIISSCSNLSLWNCPLAA